MDGGKKLDTKEREKVRIKRTPGGTKWKHVRAYRGVYLMTTPVLVAALIFYYLPMFGIRYAFFTYKGVNDPIFIGLNHFTRMFSMPGFWRAFSNTLVLSITKLILNTGMAVVISVLLNELIFLKFKKLFQTIVYIPHFMSWVVTASIFSMILSPTSAGLVNEMLMKMNLIKGGDLDNAIVVVENPVPDDQLEHLKKIFNKQDIRITGGYLNNLELRFNNELARHKLLDLLGDFALLGKRIKGRVWATRPGHFANTEFMKQVKQTIRREGEKPRFQYDCRKPPVYDINDIRRMLPHRPPFLLVDRIFYIDDTTVAGIKNVTMNEPFFVGHFPEEPVMPGVLIVEAMAQCCGMLVLRSIPDPEHYSTYFMKIDGVKFKRKVVPGDTLHFEVQLLEPIRRGVAVVEGKAFVGETLACEATMMAQIVKNKE
jgi:beta-hydroxyacyl-ACP dehydratase FabZ